MTTRTTRTRSLNRSVGWLLTSGLIGSVTLALSVAVDAQGQPAAPRAAASVSASARIPAPSASIKVGVGAPSASVRVGVGVAASASAAPSASASNGLAPPTVAPAYAAPLARKTTPPPPPPSPQQLAALAALQAEAETYEKGAVDYRDTVTAIVQLHYEEKKKEILSGLDKEIAIEKAELKKARDIAITRLEEFVQKYSGSNSQP